MLFLATSVKNNSLIYHGWLVGNDSYPNNAKLRYNGYVDKSVYGLNHLLEWLCSHEYSWQYISQEYRINEKGLRRKAYDFYIKIGSRNILIEYDGKQHYIETKQEATDACWTKVAQSRGFEVVRIPYFLQLDTKLINLLFNVKLNSKVSHTFPQGFIVNGKNNPWNYKSALPCDYNKIGFKDYNNFLTLLSTSGMHDIVEQINKSFADRLKDYGLDNFVSITDY